ncbi:MAG: PadR family transcriptional regulator [Pseudomonadota bacterium]
MNVRSLCLAILHHQDATGYEIRKLSTDGKYAHFVDASFGSIYPALAKLEEEGLVTSRQEQQVGKPPRKVYMINEAGRDALKAHLKEEPSADIFRSEFLLIGMCADLLDEGDFERALDVHIQQVEQKVAMVLDLRESMVGTKTQWLGEYGVACLSAQLQWLEAQRQAIIDDANALSRAGVGSERNHVVAPIEVVAAE